MIKENKELLLKDLSARLPYNPLIHIHSINVDDYDNYLCEDYLAKFRVDSIVLKPYLRPMSSMTEEERNYFQKLAFPYDFVDALNKYHFDYRGLISKDLAIDMTKRTYKL